MINIISFPDFGCGGLFCTLFNKTTIEWNNNFPNTLMNYEHNGLKIGANYMNNWQYEDSDWLEAVDNCKRKFLGKFCGTHIPLNNLKDLSMFDKKVQICTETLSSKLILWLRAHNLIYLPKHSIDNVVKQKQFAKDFTDMTIKPFHGAINIELSNYLYDVKYRKNIHQSNNLPFDKNVFNTWKNKNAYIFNLQKSNVAFNVFYQNVQNI